MEKPYGEKEKREGGKRGGGGAKFLSTLSWGTFKLYSCNPHCDSNTSVSGERKQRLANLKTTAVGLWLSSLTRGPLFSGRPLFPWWPLLSRPLLPRWPLFSGSPFPPWRPLWSLLRLNVVVLVVGLDIAIFSVLSHKDLPARQVTAIELWHSLHSLQVQVIQNLSCSWVEITDSLITNWKDKANAIVYNMPLDRPVCHSSQRPRQALIGVQCSYKNWIAIFACTIRA